MAKLFSNGNIPVVYLLDILFTANISHLFLWLYGIIINIIINLLLRLNLII